MDIYRLWLKALRELRKSVLNSAGYAVSIFCHTRASYNSILTGKPNPIKRLK